MKKLIPDQRAGERERLVRQVRDTATNYATAKFAGVYFQKNNGEVEIPPYVNTFTKGLEHDDYGIPVLEAVEAFKSAISQQQYPDRPDIQKRHTPFPNRKKGFPGLGGNYDYPNNNSVYPDGTAEFFHVPHPDNSHFHLKTKQDPKKGEVCIDWRGWESPLAAHTFELQGPDSDSVAMPEAPCLGSDELTAEIAEVYAMALLRDVPFAEFEAKAEEMSATPSGATTQTVIDALNRLPWFDRDQQIENLNDREKARRQARFGDASPGKLDRGNLFRGSTPGAKVGPWISQFLLIGNNARTTPPGVDCMPMVVDPAPKPAKAADHDANCIGLGAGGGIGVANGLIKYGAQTITQFFVPQLAHVDYMTDWASWIDVQNGADRRGLLCFDTRPRFIHTPRDLATYVHFDALYQAYLNACLIMIGLGVPGDRGLPEGMYSGLADDLDHPTRDSFATFGVAHILSLVTEVSTRALKAARRQKFQIHLRARPEALAGVLAVSTALSRSDSNDKLGKAYSDKAADMVKALKDCGIVDFVIAHNKKSNAAIPSEEAEERMKWINPDANLLLPMAFPEGSPMHPCYAAGHATVAGACVTVLKAFFEMYEEPIPIKRGRTKLSETMSMFRHDNFKSLFPAEMALDKEGYYQTNADVDGRQLARIKYPEKMEDGLLPKILTVQGELDKLAANISIGRNFAGVHYYTDYYESLRMGERIAVGILQEQMLTYREPVSMRFRSFDGDYMLLTGSGGSLGTDDAKIMVRNASGDWTDEDDWWHRAGDQSCWPRSK